MQPDFLTIDYLQYGTEKQRRAYMVLSESRIFEKLSIYSAVLVGTIPLNIDIETSDLDILCRWQDKDVFIRDIKRFFTTKNLTIRETVMNGNETVLINFHLHEFPVEIFGQNRMVTDQEGYRHMLIEYKILQSQDEDFRDRIIALKKSGLKTEVAFAKLLQLPGDPYQALLDYKI